MMRKKTWLLFLSAALLSTFLLPVFSSRMAAGVTIGGLDVSGLSPWETWRTLEKAETVLQCRELTICLPEETITLSHQDLGLRFRSVPLVWSAYQSGRKTQDATLPLATLQYDEEYIRACLESYALQYDTVLTQPAYRLDGVPPELGTAALDPAAPCQILVLNPGTPECHLDTEALLNQIRVLYAQAFSQEEYLLIHTPSPSVLPTELDLDAVYDDCCREAENDTLDMDTYQLIPGSYGYRFDPKEAKRKLDNAAWGQEVSISMEIIQPEILGDDVYFRDVLGHCETRHTNNENRNTNLRLVCQALDGLILQPGEEFSYNGSVGERTVERGYKPAGAYSGNRLVDSIGGGVCQGSTTLYNCALLADMEVLERNCHGFKVTYVPIGLDAAVNWATKTDMRFRNSWHFPIMIKAEVSDGYMQMQILGTDEKDYYIEMTSTYGEGEARIYSNSYKVKFDKATGEQRSKDLEARSAYMYFEG